MSRLYINDLERIKNGKIVRYNENTKAKYTSLISLSRIENEISEFRNIRFDILKKFRDDMNKELDWIKGSKIDDSYKVSLSPNKLFLNKYIALYFRNALNDNLCLFDENGLVSSNGINFNLEEKSEVILPYIKKMFNIKKQCNILDNSFYENYGIYDNNNIKVLNISGDGIILPFYDYSEFEDEEVQKLLHYYYTNHVEILKNILIPNVDDLDNYRKNIDKEKVLKLYKEGK